MANPFEDIFESIADLLSLTRQSEDEIASKKPLDTSVQEQLDDLEKNVQLFRKITDEAVKRSGLTESVIQKTIQNPVKELGQKEGRILERAKKLRGELEAIEREYARKSRVAKLQKRKEKQRGKKRRKKFKRLGGDNWMPL